MTQAQYLTYGLLTFMAIMVYNYNKPSNVDWTKMPDPRSAGFQISVLCSVMLCVLAWPIVVIGLILMAAMGDRK